MKNNIHHFDQEEDSKEESKHDEFSYSQNNVGEDEKAEERSLNFYSRDEASKDSGLSLQQRLSR
jgi:hypothetical protein